MRLTEFIHENRDSIIQDWVKFAATLTPWADGMSEADLKDHAEELLRAVVEDMNSPQSLTQQFDKSVGSGIDGALARIGQKHASDRLETGISLEQLVSEFRALRASVLRRWEKAQAGSDGDVTRFNEAIDETLAKSTSRYAAVVKTTREQFLGILGHDLRNPLGAILMAGAILKDSPNLETAEIAEMIITSANRMSRMVNDLLDLTRTRLGSGIPVTKKMIDMGLVCKEIIAELQAMHPTTQLHLESHGDLSGNWDTDRMSQAVSNLTANAIQYGEKGKPVSIRATAQKDTITIEVHNEGAAIPESLMRNLFDPMVRHRPGTRSDESNRSGLGLGLYIAHEVVDAHDGTLTVTSTEKQGTRFCITLPRDAL